MSLVVNATKAQCSISVEGLLDTIQEQDEDVKIIVQRHMYDASLWSDDSHTLI
ncbi:hypothetical protein Csa_021154 [Cucumis sativus]|uniref:Uncharacterized protein n=1 Tax=Cucumis sativus TaxID=3659 RepID=A0A0A0LK89_CUCSA|nr:hypothetical protein Csa_021154 [Cucumis sativus]